MRAFQPGYLITIMMTTFAAQILFCLLVAREGGITQVPFLVFGLCQIIPGIIVLTATGSYRRQLLGLFKKPAFKLVIALSLLATFAVLSAITLAYINGNTRPLEGFTGHYALKDWLPAPFLGLPNYFLYLLCLAPLLHLFNATTEEIMWRGYLLDALRNRLSTGVSIFASGLIWGAWHIPMVVMLDWVFPDQPVVGSLMFTASLACWGSIMAWSRVAARSLWPAIMMHAFFNALTIGLYNPLAQPNAFLISNHWGVAGILIALSTLLLIHLFYPRKQASIQGAS
ncbi:MAG: CPBP family intramembrane glutamic endopeptidase [Alcanivorax sp.]|uniref:CPBP family intramembrane glutamic endopeptidase n=1 Tax=Alcanivorax sp. TaxID=1872427 RepID=UPI003DA71513